MLEIACATCGRYFLPKKKNHQCCSDRCSMLRWRKNNINKWNKYQKDWRDSHPENIENYNAKKRRGVSPRACRFCGIEFRPACGHQKFCTVKCRDKSEAKRPNTIAWRRKYSKQYYAKDAEGRRAYGRDFYRKNTLRKLKVQPWITLLTSRRAYAKKHNIPFDLDSDWAKSRWTNRCALTGIEFSPIEKRVGYKNRNLSPSIDRIIPSNGYVKNNCRFVIWAINSFKRDENERLMFVIAEALLKNNGYTVIAP